MSYDNYVYLKNRRKVCAITACARVVIVMPFASVQPTYQSPICRWNVLLLIGLLCIGVLLQILGAPLTFWDLEGSCDLVELSLLAAVAIISGAPVLFSILGSSYLSEEAFMHRRSPLRVVFHPPLPIV